MLSFTVFSIGSRHSNAGFLQLKGVKDPKAVKIDIQEEWKQYVMLQCVERKKASLPILKVSG
jgi:hypothetical protein